MRIDSRNQAAKLAGITAKRILIRTPLSDSGFWKGHVETFALILALGMCFFFVTSLTGMIGGRAWSFSEMSPEKIGVIGSILAIVVVMLYRFEPWADLRPRKYEWVCS